MTRDVNDKEQIVNDSILWNDSIARNIFKMYQYLIITGKSEIINNNCSILECKHISDDPS